MILQINSLSKYYAIERGMFKQESGVAKALDNVSFSMDEFDSVGIVGESGSGKTTLAKIILKLLAPTSGEVAFNAGVITDFRRDVQMIFQNPYNSLNPKMRIIDIISEPLVIHKITASGKIKSRVAELLETVGLEGSAMSRLPREFSGGQRQRICIARALATQPKFIVLDEPISSLDLTVQLQMLELFSRLKDEFRLTYIFISHNLAVVSQIADKVIVMQSGKIVEEASCRDIFTRPKHPYTNLLLQAARS